MSQPTDLVISTTPQPGTRVLTLNRPPKRNALSQDLIDQLLRQLQLASADPEVRSIIITGAGGLFSGKPCHHLCPPQPPPSLPHNTTAQPQLHTRGVQIAKTPPKIDKKKIVRIALLTRIVHSRSRHQRNLAPRRGRCPAGALSPGPMRRPTQRAQARHCRRRGQSCTFLSSDPLFESRYAPSISGPKPLIGCNPTNRAAWGRV